MEVTSSIWNFDARMQERSWCLTLNLKALFEVISCFDLFVSFICGSPICKNKFSETVIMSIKENKSTKNTRRGAYLCCSLRMLLVVFPFMKINPSKMWPKSENKFTEVYDKEISVRS